MSIRLFWLVVISMSMTEAVASAEGSVCYSGQSAVSSEPPKGWSADYAGATKVGICIAYILNGYTFDTTPATIYPLLMPAKKRTPSGAIDLDDFIKGDIARFSGHAPKVKVERAPGLKSHSGIRFVAREFLNGPSPNEFEEVAYVGTNDAVLMAILSARTAGDLQKYKPAFLEFVSALEIVPRTAQFPVLKATAERETATAAGAKYKVALMGEIGTQVAGAVRECPRPSGEGFTAVLQVLKDGVVHEITFDRPSAVADCVKDKLKGLRGPRPPSAPFHVLLEVSSRQ